MTCFRHAFHFKVNHKHNQFAATMRFPNMPVNNQKHAMNNVSSCELKTWIDDKKIGQPLPNRHADEPIDLQSFYDRVRIATRY